MARKTVQLDDGWKIGDTVHKEVELTEVSTAMMFAANDAAEKVVVLPGGQPALVVSDVLLDRHLLAQQIVRVGTHKDIAITADRLTELSRVDYLALQTAAGEMDMASKIALEAHAERGRDEEPPKGS